MITAGRVAGLIQAMGGGADPAAIEAAVQDWLDAHPEATTTVQDGSITEQKLATSIAQKLGLISSLSDEIDDVKSTLDTRTLTKTIISGLYENGTINTAGQIVTDNRFDLYIAPVTSGESVYIHAPEASNEIVYAFYSAYPVYGATGVNGRIVVASSETTATVPSGAKYIAMREAKLNPPYAVIVGSMQDRMTEAENTVTENSSKIIAITNEIGDLYTVEYTPGAYVSDANGHAVFQTTGISASYKTYEFDCIGYSALSVVTYASTERAIYVTDDSYKILATISTGADSATLKTTTTVTIPSGGTKLLIPCYYVEGYEISLIGVTVRTEFDSTKALINSYFPEIADINPCDYDGNEISVFRKFLCIGDSFTEGGFNADAHDPDEDTGFADYSYPTVLSRLTGADVVNMGHGGETAQSWNRTYTSTITGGYDACIILLGINDCVNYGSFNTESQTALGAIIAKVQQENPHIKIFVSTIPIYPAFDTSAIRASTQIIKDYITSLANADLYVMDMETNNHLRNSIAYQYGHPTALGYARLAQDYYNYISWIINQNLEEFRWVQFIGTNYTHNN